MATRSKNKGTATKAAATARKASARPGSKRSSRRSATPVTTDPLIHPQSIKLYGRPVDGMVLTDNKVLGPALSAHLGRTKAVLVAVRGYEASGYVMHFESAVLMVLPATGKTCKDPSEWLLQTENGEIYEWSVTGDDPSLRFDYIQGDIESLLIDAQDQDMTLDQEIKDSPFMSNELWDDSNDDDGGTIIRAPDGRLYFVPGDLGLFEVTDEDLKSSLVLEEETMPITGADVQVLLEDGEQSPSTGGAKRASGRGKLAARGKLTARGKLSARGKLAGRGKLAARGKLAGRGKLATRGKLSARGKMSARGKLAARGLLNYSH